MRNAQVQSVRIHAVVPTVCTLSTLQARAGMCSLDPKVIEEATAGMDELMQCRKHVWKHLVCPSVCIRFLD